jgi:hypothetical protein
MMRQEEEIAKNAICDWLYSATGCFPLNIYPEPNGVSTVPDYLFEFKHINSYLEVTLSGHGFLSLSDSSIRTSADQRDKIQYEYSLNRFIGDKYDLDLQSGNAWISPEHTILVFILSPIPLKKRSKLSERIFKIIKDGYLNNQLVWYSSEKERLSGQFDIFLDDEEVKKISIRVFVTNFYKQYSKYIPIRTVLFPSFSSSNKALENSYSAQAEYILVKAISNKEKKCRQVPSPVWLAIVNTHPSLSVEDYVNVSVVIERMYSEKISRFSKVFVVDKQKAYQLFSD